MHRFHNKELKKLRKLIMTTVSSNICSFLRSIRFITGNLLITSLQYLVILILLVHVYTHSLRKSFYIFVFIDDDQPLKCLCSLLLKQYLLHED